MANSLILDNLPFANVADNVVFDRNKNQNVYIDINNLPSSNNDVLNDIDPDINNLIPNCIQNQCKGYDTSSELRKDICFQNNIAMLHTNICNSSKKIKYFTYYIDNFNFRGLSETWASEINHDLLEIPGDTHEQCLCANKKKGGGPSLYIHHTI